MSIANLIYPALGMIGLLNGQNKKEDRFDEINQRISKLQEDIKNLQITPTNTEQYVEEKKDAEKQISDIEKEAENTYDIGYSVPINNVNNASGNHANNAPNNPIRQLCDELTAISGELDEALRFAREDGIDHNESMLRLRMTKKRISDETEGQILKIERDYLSPANIANLTGDEKKVIDHVLPQIRRLRQQVLNNMNTIEGIEKSSAMANNIAVQLKVAMAVMAQKNKNPKPYSNYAPNMNVDTGCIECGKAHIIMADEAIKNAANIAKEKGFANDRVQKNLIIAQKELSAMLDYDFTPEKIENMVGEEKELLKRYRPEIINLYKDLSNMESEEELYNLTNKSNTIRNSFKSDLEAIQNA